MLEHCPSMPSIGRKTRNYRSRSRVNHAPKPISQTKKAARAGGLNAFHTTDQSFTLSLRALAMVIFTTLSASLWICSPVAGLRTMRAGRSRQ